MPRIGICPATLVRDPLACGPDELTRALDAAHQAGFESLSRWAMHHATLGAAADHPACGFLLDTWHWARQPTGSGLEQLADVDLERATDVQFDDAPLEPVVDDLYEETLNHRLVPGDGEVDLVGLLSAVRRAGADPYVAPEVFNRQMVHDDPAAMATRIAEGTSRILAAAGWGPSDA